MENHMQRLNRLEQLAKSTSLRDREQIRRIIRSTDDAAENAQKTAEVLKRIMSGQKPSS
jgi:hypothetical protein